MIYQNQKLRHEIKFYINQAVCQQLRTRLQVFLKPDPNMKDPNGYLISSVYFDDFMHQALHQKESGIEFRKKYRIRLYEKSDAVIKLECKRKNGEFIAKTSAPLSRSEYDQILRGDYAFLAARTQPVCRELYALHHKALLKPCVCVEYLREAYVLPQGNVRITFDKDISASWGVLDPLQPGYTTQKILDPGVIVLEVKFDDYLPSFVKQILQTAMTEKCAISKYVLCRQNKKGKLYR